MTENADFTWTQASAAIWSSVEHNIGIACNSLARLKPFVHRHFPNFSLSIGKSSGKHYEGRKSSGIMPRLWRGDKAGHNFQLHSFDAHDSTNDGDHIRVENE